MTNDFKNDPESPKTIPGIPPEGPCVASSTMRERSDQRRWWYNPPLMHQTSHYQKYLITNSDDGQKTKMVDQRELILIYPGSDPYRAESVARASREADSGVEH